MLNFASAKKRDKETDLNSLIQLPQTKVLSVHWATWQNQQPFEKGVKEIHSMIDPMIALHPESTSQLDKRIWHISEIRDKQKAYSGNGYWQKQILDASLPWLQMNELQILSTSKLCSQHLP